VSRVKRRHSDTKAVQLRDSGSAAFAVQLLPLCRCVVLLLPHDTLDLLEYCVQTALPLRIAENIASFCVCICVYAFLSVRERIMCVARACARAFVRVLYACCGV